MMAKSQQRTDTRWSATQPPGFVMPEALYTIEEVKARLRMGNKTWRQLRRRGVEVIRFGRRHYIMGSMVIEALKQIGKEQEEG